MRRLATIRGLSDAVTILMILAIIGAAYLLPPDTSLKLARERGTLRMCVPTSYPPLVTEDPARPGVDVELAQAIAERLGLRLILARSEAIGRDFNPRNWRITRAQCEMIGGGVITTGITRSFLETTPPHLETGWTAVRAPEASAGRFDGVKIGFVPGASGLDRLALSRHLRAVGADVRPYPDVESGVAALRERDVEALVTEHLQARAIAARGEWRVERLEALERYPLGFGLWKGDLTLKRAVVAAVAELERDGTLAEIERRYGLGSPAETGAGGVTP